MRFNKTSAGVNRERERGLIYISSCLLVLSVAFALMSRSQHKKKTLPTNPFFRVCMCEHSCVFRFEIMRLF